MLRCTALVLIVAAANVLSQDEVDMSKPCGPHMFKGMDRCCLLPQLIPFESFETCFDKEEETKDQIASETKRKRSKKGKTKGGRMCLIQCGMRNENMLDAEGNVNTTSVNEKLTAVAAAHWDPLVPGAIANCTAEYAKLDLSEIPAQEDKNGQICKPGPSLFLSCINHRLSSECPSNSLGTIDPLCPQRFAYLKSCSPFSLIEGWKKRARSAVATGAKKAKVDGVKSKKSKKNKQTN